MQVNQPDGQINQLLRELPESGVKEDEAVEKVKQIGAILREDPSLKNDAELLNRVFSAVNAMPDAAIKEKCRTLLLSEAPALELRPRIPEGAFGPDEWQECGIIIDKVPPVPEVILNRANPENYFVVLIPGNVGFSELIERSGIEVDYVQEELRAEYGSKTADLPYWVAIETKVLDKSINTQTRQEQLDMASSDGQHRAPSILEAVACNIASIKTTGKGLWWKLWDNEPDPTQTCCREDTLAGKKLSDGLRFVVGSGHSGLCVYIPAYSFFYIEVGVARLLA